MAWRKTDVNPPPLYELDGHMVSAEIIEAHHEKVMQRVHQILDDDGADLRENDEAKIVLRRVARAHCPRMK